MGEEFQIFSLKGIARYEYDACYVGRVSEGKGISELLLAWREVVKTIPAALLAIAGSADQQVRAQSAAENSYVNSVLQETFDSWDICKTQH